MSEKLYSWLLRLYPSRFRAAYGEDAMQLFRDRLRDERGLFLRLRLWFDLLADFALSLPRQHSRVEPALAAAPGFPVFLLIDDRPLQPRRWCAGALLSFLAAFSSVAIARLEHPKPANLLTHFMPGQNGLKFPHGPEPKMPPPPEVPTVPVYRAGSPPPNCTLEQAQILPHRITYLKAALSPNQSVCLYAAAAAMASLHTVDALILDMRENRPDDPGKVSFLGQLSGKPVYILTSRHNPPGAAVDVVLNFKVKAEDVLRTAQRLAEERIRPK